MADKFILDQKSNDEIDSIIKGWEKKAEQLKVKEEQKTSKSFNEILKEHQGE